MSDDKSPPLSDEAQKPFRTTLSGVGLGAQPHHEHFKRIGIVCAEWASFEARLDLTIQVLTTLEPSVAAAITSQINGPVPRLRVILSLLEIKGVAKTTRGKIVELMGRTHGIADERNRVVHDAWYYEHTEQSVQQRRSGRIGKSFVHEYRKVTADDLDDLTRRIHEHHMSFMAIYIEIQDDPSRPFAYMLQPKPP